MVFLNRKARVVPARKAGKPTKHMKNFFWDINNILSTKIRVIKLFMNVSVQQPWLIGMNMHELEMIGPRVYLNRGNQDLKLNHKPYVE